MSNQSWDTVWCYFRNALHSTYREIRHLGLPDDPEAKALPPSNYYAQAQKCQTNRKQLQSTVPFRDVSYPSTSDYIQAYVILTDLKPEELSDLFQNAHWKHGFGGENWAAITDTVIELAHEIDSVDLAACKSLCRRLRGLRHNNGPLVPSRKKWEEDFWQREKWPELCDYE